MKPSTRKYWQRLQRDAVEKKDRRKAGKRKRGKKS